MYRRLSAVNAILLALAYGVGLASAAEPWTMFQSDAGHTGYVPVALDPNGFSLRWETQVGGTLTLNPVTAADGKVFVSQLGYFSDAGLFVLKADSGEVLWSTRFGRVFSVNPPSYAYGNVYIQTGNHGSDTYLRAYDAETGVLVFRAPHSAQWGRYYAPTIYDGKVYVDGGYYGGMYAFDAYTGEQLWFYGLNQYDEWTPAVDENYAYAYTGSYSPNLSVVDRHTGLKVFSIPDPNFDWRGWSMDLAPVLGSQNNVLAIHNDRLINFDLEARSISWELTRSFSGQPCVAHGVIYAMDAGALTAWDEITQAFLWSWEVPSESLTGTLIVTDSHVLTRTSDAVYAVDLETHESIWSYPASGHMALGEDVLYLATSQEGGLVAINVTEGDSEPPPTLLPLDIKPGSCPNPLNLKSRGKLPVALLGTEDFDVSAIDPATIVLARADGVGDSVSPYDGPPGPYATIEDVGTPFEGELCDCHEVDGDGIDDLSIKFSRPVIVAALALRESNPGATVELVVSGALLDGTPFSASDCILIVPQADFDEDNDVDQSDFGHLQACYRGPLKRVDLACRDADIDGDGDVDISDFGRLQRCVSGAQKAVNPRCAD